MGRPQTKEEWDKFWQKKNQKRKEYIERSKERRKEKFNQSVNGRLRTVRISNRSGSHKNCFRFHPNNSDLHEDCKYDIHKFLRRKGHDLMSECIFESGKRADILDLTSGIIYEVLGTEKDEDCDSKTQTYPDCFEIIKIDAKTDYDLEKELEY